MRTNILTPLERQFLIKAFEVEKHLRPTASPDRIIPLLSWRTIGVLCDLTGEQSDRLVAQLAAANQVLIMNADERLIMLSEGREWARQELDFRKRRLGNWLKWIGIGLALVVYWLIRRS